MSSANLYPKVSNFDRVYTIKRNNKFPIDVNSVKHSIIDLKKYLNDKTSDAYPGQIVAIDDDLTSNTFVDSKNRDEIGLYYIYCEDSSTKKLNYKKLAFLDSIGPDLEKVICLLNKINNLNNNQPWQVMSDNDNKPNIYNKDTKLYTDIIDQYNEAGISLNVTISPK